MKTYKVSVTVYEIDGAQEKPVRSVGQCVECTEGEVPKLHRLAAAIAKQERDWIASELSEEKLAARVQENIRRTMGKGAT